MSLFLFAGEHSGDLHGEALMQAIRVHCPNLSIFGVGGPRMRTEGLDTIMEMERFQVMGFLDVLLALPRIVRQFYSLRRAILTRQPKVAIFIDYPGFTLALEKSLRKKGFKGEICHYICPSVWAWGKNRILKMEEMLNHLFVIFPFEKKLFHSHKLQVHYVGHPLIHRINKSSSSYVPLELPKDRPLISLFPGSRIKELNRNLAIQLNVAKQLLTLYPEALLAISVASPTFKEHIHSSSAGLEILFIESKNNYSLMRQSTLAIAKSGTIILELALHLVPTVVTYGLSKLDLFIARDILRIRLPYYSIVNILLQEEVFPELIGPNLTEKKLLEATTRLLSFGKAREDCREKCAYLRTILSDKEPSGEIARLIKNFYR